MATRSVAGRGGWVRGRAMARPEGEESCAVAVAVRTGPCPLRIVVPGPSVVGISAALLRFGGWFDEHG
jgi:hypothetical protein